MEADSYITIKSFSQGIYKEKGSRFIASAYPVSDIEEIRTIIDNIRKEYHDARHHCYAYMIGYERITWRVNDDGEPSGTAGRPILGQINSFGLTNILIVVTRYFGGTLLGVSGLIQAYKSAAASAIGNSEIVSYTVQEFYEISFPYISLNTLMKMLKEEGIGQSEQSFDLECKMRINFRLSARDRILMKLSRIEGLKYRFIETV